MKRILIFLFFSTFLLFQIGCEKAPDSPVTPDNPQETQKGFSSGSLYEIPGQPPVFEGCGDYTTDILICPDLNDWYGKNTQKIGTLTVSDNCDNLIFTFTVTELGYFITEAVGDAWVYDAIDDRYVPPQIRNVSGSWSVNDLKTSVTLTMPKDFMYYIGPKLKDLSFYPGDVLGLAAYMKVCSKNGVLLGDNLPLTTVVNYEQPNPDLSSYLLVDTDSPILGVDKKGWCVDVDGKAWPNENIPSKVYSSLTDILTGIVDKPANMGKVNWILNNIFPGQDLGNPDPVSYIDIQNVIWELMDNTDYTEPGGSKANFDAILLQANAHANFKPGCDEVYGVILHPDPRTANGKTYQTILIERPVKCSFGEGCLDGCAFGNQRYCLDLPGFPGGFWHWVSIGYVFCCPD